MGLSSISLPREASGFVQPSLDNDVAINTPEAEAETTSSFDTEVIVIMGRY